MDSPGPSDPSPDDDDAARRQAQARRQARQRRQRLFLVGLLIGIVATVIFAASDARPRGVTTPLSPEEARWFTAFALLGFVTILLAVLATIVVLQWPWRRHFVLRRGGLLLALWAVATLIWLAGPTGDLLTLVLEVLLMIGGVLAGGFLRYRQRKGASQTPMPEELYQDLAAQRAKVARNRALYPTVAAGALYKIALIEQQIGNPVAARHALEEALIIYDEQGVPLAQANCLNLLGTLIGDEHPQRALANYEQALARFQAEVKGRFRWKTFLGLDSDVAYEIMFLNNIGHAHLKLGQPAQALPPLEEALTLYRRAQEPRSMLPSVLINLSLAQARLGHLDRARALADNARAGLAAVQSELRPDQLAALQREMEEELEPLLRGEIPADVGSSSPAGTLQPPEAPMG